MFFRALQSEHLLRDRRQPFPPPSRARTRRRHCRGRPRCRGSSTGGWHATGGGDVVHAIWLFLIGCCCFRLKVSGLCAVCALVVAAAACLVDVRISAAAVIVMLFFVLFRRGGQGGGVSDSGGERWRVFGFFLLGRG